MWLKFRRRNLNGTEFAPQCSNVPAHGGSEFRRRNLKFPGSSRSLQRTEIRGKEVLKKGRLERDGTEEKKGETDQGEQKEEDCNDLIINN